MDEQGSSMKEERGSLTPETGPGAVVLPSVPEAIATQRHRAGYRLMLVALILGVFAFGCAVVNIYSMSVDSTASLPMFYGKVALEGLLTFVFMLFCYALLQTAERMILPVEWVRNSDDLRLMLGVKTPASLVSAEVTKMAKTIEPIIRAVGDATKRT